MGRRILAVLISASFLGCGLTDRFFNPEPRACSDLGPTVQVAGEWVISGLGRRNDCEDESFLGNFDLGPSSALTVAQTDSSTVAELSLTGSLAGFELTGEVEGPCIQFATREQTGTIGTIVYQFDGQLERAGLVTGTFTGTGPEACTSEGEFEAEISR